MGKAETRVTRTMIYDEFDRLFMKLNGPDFSIREYVVKRLTELFLKFGSDVDDNYVQFFQCVGKVMAARYMDGLIGLPLYVPKEPEEETDREAYDLFMMYEEMAYRMGEARVPFVLAGSIK